MKHDCPHCGVPLRMKLVLSKPLPGERQLLPNQAVPVCPHCGGSITSNHHWSEFVVGLVMSASLLAVPVARGGLGPRAPVLGAVVIGGWCVMLLFFHLRYWRHWPRYKKAALSHPARR